MALQDADITQIVATIWQSVLGVECGLAAEVPVLPESASSGTLSACVQITGAWKGAVVLTCPEAFAGEAAMRMFNTPEGERSLTDMQDAIAELSNMIGGNLKGLLTVADACQLSLPSVVAGADYTTRIPGSRLVHRIPLECSGHTIVINVLQKSAAANAA
jgi:chemotaxis protein CheX